MFASKQEPSVGVVVAPKAGEPAAPIGYGARTAQGGLITTIVVFAASGINFGTQIILSWFLAPNDFGVLALAGSFMAIIAVFRDSGTQQILIQRQKDFDRVAGSAYWLTLISSMLCALATAVAAPVVAHAKGNPTVKYVMWWLAARFVVSAFGTVSNAKLVVDMRWGMLAAINLASPVAAAIVSLTFAWLGLGVYSLVLGPIAGDLVKSIACWQAAGVRGAYHPDRSVLFGVLASSGFIVGTSLTIAARANGDYLTLSFKTDEVQTGLYYFAFVFAAGLAKLATGGLTSVLLPVFAKVQQDPARHEAIFRRSVHACAAIGILPIVAQSCLAWPIFQLFLKPKWEPAAVLFCALSLLNLAKFLNGVVTQAMNAAGRFRQIFYFAIAFAPFELGMFVAGAFIAGAKGVAWCAAASALVDFLAFHWFSLRILRIPWKPTLLPLWRPVLASVPTAALALTLNQVLPHTRPNDILIIAAVTVFGTASYVAVLWTLWPQITRDLVVRATEALPVVRIILSKVFQLQPRIQ